MYGVMNKSTAPIIAVVGLVFVLSVIETQIPDFVPENALVFGIIEFMLVFWWVREHAIENKITVPFGSRVLYAIFSLWGVPYYFFKKYGAKSGAVKVLKAIGLLILLTAISIVTNYLL